MHINDYIHSTTSYKNLTIMGGSGFEKTTVCQLITLYALCYGLNGTATSFIAERSRQLGGTNFHHLFGLLGNDVTTHPRQIAKSTIHRLFINTPNYFGNYSGLTSCL
jgi:hypothetical protein